MLMEIENVGQTEKVKGTHFSVDIHMTGFTYLEVTETVSRTDKTWNEFAQKVIIKIIIIMMKPGCKGLIKTNMG